MTNLTKVSMNMTKHLLSGKNFKDKNVVFSPLSLYTVLGMVTAGSEGATQHQLLSFLQSKSTNHLKSLSSHLVSDALSDGEAFGGPCLSFVNSMWVQQSLSIQPSFKQLITSDFKATLASLDFAKKPDEASKEVNLWVKENTKGLIKDIVSPAMVRSAILIIVNAIYFKAAWKQKFDTCETKDNDFHLLDNSSVKVPFMTSKKDQFIGCFDGFKVLGLPYKQGDDEREFSLYIFLPDAKDGLLDLIDNVTCNSEFLEDMLPYEKVKVGNFRIPKFNISVGIDIKNLLKEIGLDLPFKGGLTKMVEKDDLFVSDIVQKSFIEVNEEGTTAAAATAVMISKGISMRKPTLVDFVADHPFLFMIRDDFNGTILFTGQVLNPLAKEE
ncbi:hypothetical protein P8452_59487 [Trifolium repens]|nr:hypothetical protein P8452_59487 [Trifolium repens]